MGVSQMNEDLFFYNHIAKMFKGEPLKAAEIQTEFSEVYKEGTKEALIKFFKKVKKNNEEITPRDLKSVIDYISIFTFAPDKKYSDERYLPEHIFQAGLTHFPLLKSQEGIDLVNSNVVKIDIPLSYIQIKQLSRKIFNKRFVTENRNTAFIPFSLYFSGKTLRANKYKKPRTIGSSKAFIICTPTLRLIKLAPEITHRPARTNPNT